MKILIVEDEVQLSNEIKRFLEEEGFSCDQAYFGRIASEKLFVNEYDLALLDLGLPDYEGIDLLKEIIADQKKTSVIILSARSSLDDKVKGLDLGADDYLPKPFSLTELKSRILAVTRRKYGIKSNEIIVHGLHIYLDKRTVFFNDVQLQLTKKEYDILIFLILNKNRVVSRLQISEHIWGDIIEENYNSNFIDVHIKNLRKKISDNSENEFIETIRGVGFRLNSIE
jgi:DNA-binding response OmpR family regulator